MHCVQAAEAQLHVADLWLELRARDLEECVGQVLGVMPLVLGNGSREQRALLHWTLAMLYLKTWSTDDLRAAPHRSTVMRCILANPGCSAGLPGSVRFSWTTWVP